MQSQPLAADASHNEIDEALLLTMQELSSHEQWTVKNTGALNDFGGHAIRIFAASVRSLPLSNRARQVVRQNMARVIAYMPAGMRISTIISMSRQSPSLVYDMLKGPIDPEFEPHRYNIIITLGIFARNGLFLGVTEPARMKRTQSAIIAAKRIQRIQKGEEHE